MQSIIEIIKMQTIKMNKSLIVDEISTIILEIIEENKDVTNLNKDSIKFCDENLSKIEVKKYIHRLSKYCQFQDSTLILALIYCDRFCEMQEIKLQIINFHKIFLLSIVSAIKYNEDIYYRNSFYARIGGITLKCISDLERLFLDLLEFSLYVDEDMYEKYQNFVQIIEESYKKI